MSEAQRALSTLLLLPLALLSCESPQRVDAASPEISVSACKTEDGTERCTVYFGEVQTGATETARIELENTSRAELVVYYILLVNDERALVFRAPDLAPPVLDAGGTFHFNVEFTPREAIEYYGSVVIYSDARNVSDDGKLHVWLKGSGAR